MTGLDRLLERFRSRERAALARVLSLIEDETTDAFKILDSLQAPYQAPVIGITGPPGAGKSTLIGGMIAAYRSRNQSVGVLAFDPSSHRSGGAALGDRIRMSDFWDDDGVYVRSLASRGRLGGLSPAAFDVARVLDAFGFDRILIETVGVGQGEIDIADLADATILVQVPGAGDTVQLIKAGILEVADIIVVNKADFPGADQLIGDLRNLVSESATSDDSVPVIPCTASDRSGIEKLLDAIDVTVDRESDGGRRERRARAEVQHIIIDLIERRVTKQLSSANVGSLIREVADGRRISREAAREVLRELNLEK